MAIIDGQRVRASESNAAWASKTADNTFVGKQTLNRPASGSAVTDVQQEINDLKTTVSLVPALQEQVADLTDEVSSLSGSVGELAASPKYKVYTFDLEALQDVSFSSGTSFLVTGLLLPDNMAVKSFHIKVTEQFAGTGLTAAIATIGEYAGVVDMFMGPTSVLGAPGDVNWASNSVDYLGDIANTGFDVNLELTGCDIADLTAGAFDVYVMVSDISLAEPVGWR